MRTKQQIYDFLESLIADKSKIRFFNHLVISYINKDVKKIKTISDTKPKCVLSECELSSIEMCKDDTSKVLGVYGSNTTTAMSFDSYALVFDWVMAKYLRGNKHIVWLLNKNKCVKENPFVELRKKEVKRENRAMFNMSNVTGFDKLMEKFNYEN